MGLLDRFRRKALHASPQVLEAAQDRTLNLNGKLAVSAQVRAAWMQFQSASYGYLYGNQPAVRAVVDYIATNVAQLGPKLYERVSETEREEKGDHPAAELLRQPNPWTPGKQFILDVFGDFLVYSNAYVLKVQPEPGGARFLLPVPPSAVAVLGTGVSQVAGYTIHRTDGSNFTVLPEEMIHWRGYNASDRAMGISKLETLRAELSEQAASQRANVDLMESGLQQRGYIKRPLEAAEWHTDGGRDRFIEQFRAAMKRADRGYPILEEGMEIAPLGVSPKDAEMLESRKLFNEEVARQYGMVHCPPESEEERLQFYADVLPPLCSSFADQLKLQLLQAEFMEDDLYFDFETALVKKQMSDERMKTLVSAAGAPIVTRNEARAQINLPALDGADGLMSPEDQLVVPLNVLTGGKPSPQVMPPQDPNKPSQDGDFREAALKQLEVSTQPRFEADMGRQRRYIDELVGTLERFYRHQLASLQSKAVFDSARWNRALSGELEKELHSIMEREGGIYVARLGGVDFDERQVRNYVQATSEKIADRLNAVTQRDFEGDGRDALERAIGARAATAGAQIGARATVFARREAAKQSPSVERRTQTWIANTERHAALDGATVGLGSDWGGIEPGSEPGCGCSAAIQ